MSMIKPEDIHRISADDLPESAEEEFWVDRSTFYRHVYPEYSTYFAHQMDRIPNLNLDSVKALDIHRDLSIVGGAVLHTHIDEPDYRHLEVPQINSNWAVEGYQNQGYGRRRVLAMQAISLLLFDKPLHSSHLRLGYEENIWQRLVEDGVAESSHLNGLKIYSFKHPSEK
jgi:hypothetical protein